MHDTPIPKTICLENSLIKPMQEASKINHNDLEITKSEEKPFFNWSIIFFTSKVLQHLVYLRLKGLKLHIKILFCMVLGI